MNSLEVGRGREAADVASRLARPRGYTDRAHTGIAGARNGHVVPTSSSFAFNR